MLPSSWKEELLHLFFPSTCPGCDTPLLRNEQLFCSTCSLELPFTRIHDDPGNDVEERFWGRFPLYAGTALFRFIPGGRVQKALYRLKYQGEPEIGRTLGRILGNELSGSERFRTVRSVLHVPLHPDKLERRGYDQAACIAEGVAETMGIPHWDGFLKRIKDTRTQTRKGRYERWQNVSEAFWIPDGERGPEPPVLLVDDVLTTGSTLEACAQHLLRNGHAPVAVATVASP